MSNKFLSFILWNALIIFGATIWFDKAYSLNIFIKDNWEIIKNAEMINKGIYFSMIAFSLTYLLGVLFVFKQSNTKTEKISVPQNVNIPNPTMNQTMDTITPVMPNIPNLNNLDTFASNNPSNLSNGTTTPNFEKKEIEDSVIQFPTLNQNDKSVENSPKTSPVPNDIPMAVGSDILPDMNINSSSGSIMNSLSNPDISSNNTATPIEQTVSTDNFTFDPNAPIDFSSFDNIEHAPIMETTKTQPEFETEQMMQIPNNLDTNSNSALSSFIPSDDTKNEIASLMNEYNIENRTMPNIKNPQITLWGSVGQTLFVGIVFSNSGKFIADENQSVWKSDTGLEIESPVRSLKTILDKISQLSKEALEDEEGINTKAFIFLENAEIENIADVKDLWNNMNISVLSNTQSELVSLKDYFENNKIEEEKDESFEAFVDAIADFIG